MFLKSLNCSHCLLCLRQYSKALPRAKVTIDENVLKDINNEVFKPRKHPGVLDTKTVHLPDSFVKSVVNVIEDYPVKALVGASKNLQRHLKGKVPPLEQDELMEKVNQTENKVLHRLQKVDLNNEEDEQRFNQMIKDKVTNILTKKVYNWKPIKYEEFNSLVYLLARSAAEYSVLVKIFGDLAKRDPNFKPKSLIDFGSGIGTVTWAANCFWKKHFFEYFNVDASSVMNDLAQTLLQGGKGNTGDHALKGVFYRQFLPAKNITYDLVVSAYTLLELPSSEARLETILNLWNKTQNYLVIVEQGTNAGFKVVNEVRDFILQIKNERNKGHVFSPCPHDKLCPRFLADDGTPCNFEVAYFSMPIGEHSALKKELYSYVVLKKGPRKEEDPQWPRIVRSTMIRSRHTICRFCTANGKLEEVVFTKSKHGKTTYHCARSSKWGDLLPVNVEKDTPVVKDSDEANSNKESVEGNFDERDD